jgi:hypothetical protein
MTMIISGSDGLEFPDGSDQGTAFTGNAATITSGTIATARLATGTANSSTYLRGDQTWAAIPATTPGGSTRQVQYNNAGAFGGDSGFVYDASSNVGIGTASPSAKVTVVNNAPSVATGQILAAYTGYSGVALTQGSTSEGYLWNINNSYLSLGTNNTERMRIDSSGNVGIGTTSPATRLHVTSSTAVQARIETTGSSAGFQAFTNAGANTVGALDFTSSAMIFYTGIGSASAAERMRIDSSGNVGIGTSSPVGLLHLNTTSGSAALFMNSPSASGAGSYISLRKGDSAKFLVGVESTLSGTSDNGLLYVYGSNALTIYTNGTEQARITSAGLMQFNSGYGSVANAYGCRAWVNFHGTSTVSIRASGNVTSITDNGTGLYQINFTTAMPDANYAVTVSGAGERDGSGGNSVFNIRAPSTNFVGSSSLATSSVQISQKTVGGGLADSDVVTVSVFR